MVEGAALEMLCTQVPRVRIPNSPPKKMTSFHRNLSFSVIFAFGRVILLRSDICLKTSYIRFASLEGEYTITSTLVEISLL